MNYTNTKVSNTSTMPDELKKHFPQRQKKIQMLQMMASMYSMFTTFINYPPMMGSNRQPKQEKHKRTYRIDGVIYRV